MNQTVSASTKPVEVVAFGEYSLDLWRKTISVKGRSSALPTQEVVLFRALGEAKGRYLSWYQLAEVLADYYGGNACDYSQVAIKTRISRLRASLKQLSTTQHDPIESRYKKGYCFKT
ncbi:MAG: hypothetical protein Q7R71_00545 [bacterium]|nr:hypothetical protein [bacterium]